MDAFVSRKRRRLSQSSEETSAAPAKAPSTLKPDSSGEDSTDIKIAILLSLFPDLKPENLLDILVSCDGSVEAASSLLSSQGSAASSPYKKRATSSSCRGAQTSLSSHVLTKAKDGSVTTLSDSISRRKPLSTRKGQTLHLYSPEDIAAYTPCTIIHNFLPTEQANALLGELLDESKHFSRYEFQLFNRTVQSPHTGCLYVSTPEEYKQHTSEYKIGGTYRSHVRRATPELRSISRKVQQAVNEAVQARIREVYPDGKKLKYQSPKEWRPNAAFVNCYDGPTENVGYHSDDLTYLGPHPVIGSISLGVEREFRVRRVIPQDEEDDIGQTGTEDKRNVPSTATNERKTSTARADAQGQISIHLPHNSLLVMHAEMQEEWKHSIAPAKTISPHPISGNRRINITYRWFRDTLHPRHTPRCLCGEHAILRCASRKQENRGRYMWMCYAGYAPGKESCSFFQWAEFDDDGDPVWTRKRQEDEVAPRLASFSASQ
ncbi:DNA oxidative demethylase ALKBH2 [Penicillium rolfsii]|nr:DNA oxidative demethylase ALKBH2 [Penicillium rolfsii]